MKIKKISSAVVIITKDLTNLSKIDGIINLFDKLIYAKNNKIKEILYKESTNNIEITCKITHDIIVILNFSLRSLTRENSTITEINPRLKKIREMRYPIISLIPPIQYY